MVEGYTDVIQLYQRGIHNVVSSSGTALTPEQIRLIHRLTKNITLLFDGDAAGLRASLRGVDLILEQGLNVKVCTFPEGEDPDSFARENTLEDLTLYLEENATDFINLKASLLAKEAKNDPIKKAETIRDMVTSISKIPDHIKQEVYLKECSRIMDISEEVLFSTLAQMLEKDRRDRGKKARQETRPMEVVTKAQAPPIEKTDPQFLLERKIIELLLLYGDQEAEFEEMVMETQEDGTVVHTPERVSAKVYDKIYLDLHLDEIEFANEDFQEIYHAIMAQYQQEESLKLEQLIQELPAKPSEHVTHILMDDEKYLLNDWERREIYVKGKKDGVAQLVSDTVLNLRRLLVSKKIDELSHRIKEGEEEDNPLQNIVDYLSLKKVLSEKLNRVV